MNFDADKLFPDVMAANPLERIKELEALAQKLVDAMKDAHPYVEDDAKRAGIGNMIVEAAKLGIK